MCVKIHGKLYLASAGKKTVDTEGFQGMYAPWQNLSHSRITMKMLGLLRRVAPNFVIRKLTWDPKIAWSLLDAFPFPKGGWHLLVPDLNSWEV